MGSQCLVSSPQIYLSSSLLGEIRPEVFNSQCGCIEGLRKLFSSSHLVIASHFRGQNRVFCQESGVDSDYIMVCTIW